jgi:hypothetical protein
VLPQKFEAQFGDAGQNIHDPKFGAWWEKTSHLRNASAYSAAWERFLQTNPSQAQILDFARQLATQYGLQVFF